MDDSIVILRSEPDGTGGQRLLSPRIGRWIDPPRVGSLLGPGSRVGTLVRLNAREALVLPDAVSGRVTRVLSRDRVVDVEFGQVLFELAALGEDAQSIGSDETAPYAASGSARLPEGTRAVVSPTDGTFYLRPGPGAPPFVTVGARIASGHPIGLVEVMKTFNRVLYGGPGFPEEAEVVAVLCEDAAEVHAGQPLVLVR